MEPLLINTEEYENSIQKISRLTVSQVTILLQLFFKDYIVFLISNKTFPIFEHLAGATEYHPLLLFNLKKMKTV